MTSLPPAFEERMKTMLGTEADAFFAALRTSSPVSIRLNPDKSIVPTYGSGDHPARQVEWCDPGLYLNERPIFTLDPCFHGGAYYVQEASSMFLSHILQQIMPSRPVRALDLCAAPGGKSTLMASMLPAGSLLVANEVIRSRASVLKENIIKWGRADLVVTNNDPADFSELSGAFDVMLVDAPCSGEGMFRKDEKAVEEWSEANLKLCCERQKRILSDTWDCLKPGGFLVYSTCTYNRGENEEILEWIVSELEGISINIEHSFNNITPSDSETSGYHFYPHKTEGEGFFIGVVQKQDGKEWIPQKSRKQDKTKPVLLPAELGERLFQPEQYTGYLTESTTGFFPEKHREFIAALESNLRVTYKGCEAIEINNRKIKFQHPLALYSGLRRERCTVYDTDLHTALTYLKKEDIPVTAPNGEWVLITHRNIAIGWGKSLGSRLNNYYPKEWRIRMKI